MSNTENDMAELNRKRSWEKAQEQQRRDLQINIVTWTCTLLLCAGFWWWVLR